MLAGAGDAAVIRTGAALPPPVFEDWEVPIHQRVSAGLPDAAPPVPVDRELVDGDVLDFGGGAEILAIPGHTEGSIAIHLPRHGVLFTGDTIANVGIRHARRLQPGPRDKPSRRSAGWRPSTSRPPASATASRSRRVPRTGFARWLPH